MTTRFLATLLVLFGLTVGAQAAAFDYDPPPVGSSDVEEFNDLNLELDGINTDKTDFVDIDTSAELRTILGDETGSGFLMFGLSTDMTDNLTCSGSQVVRRNSGDTAFECATLSGVTGPGSSTDNGIATWDGTGGAAIQDTTILIDDNNVLVSGHTAAIATFESPDGTDLTPDLQAHSTGSDASLGLSRWNTSAGSPARLFIAKSEGATIGAYDLITDGDDLGHIVFLGSDGTDFEVGATIEASTDNWSGSNDVGADDMPGMLIFATTPDGSTTPGDKMYILSDPLGRVIGYSTDAGASGGPIYELYRDSGSAAASDEIGNLTWTGRDAGGGYEVYANIDVIIDDATATSEDATLRIRTDGAGTVTNRLTINSTDATFDVVSVNLHDQTELRLREDEGNGSNYIGFIAPSAITSDFTCTLENDSTPIPDSCVGDGTDAGGSGVTGPGTSTDNGIATYDGTGGTTLQDTAVIVDDNDVLAFGVTSTSALWNVNVRPRIQVVGSSTLSGSSVGVARHDIDDADAAYIILAKSADATAGTHANVASGERLGTISFEGSNGTNFDTAALIRGFVDAEPTTAGDTTDMPGRIELMTSSDGSSSPTSRLMIDSLGHAMFDSTGTMDQTISEGVDAKLGITNTNPANLWNMVLSAHADDTNGASLSFYKSDNATPGSETLIDDGDDIGLISADGSDGSDSNNRAAQILFEVDGEWFTASDSSDSPGRIVFSTTPDGAGGSGGVVERLRIAASGAFGIAGANYGTTNQALLSGGSSTTPAWTSIIGKNAIWIPAGSLIPRTTNGCEVADLELGTNDIMIRTCNYDTATEEGAGFTIRMPDTWNEGTLTVVPVWTHPATATNFGVVWGFSCLATSNDDAMDAALGTQVTSTDTGGTTSDQYTGPETAAMTCAGTPQAGDTIYVEAERVVGNASDNMAVDAYLLGYTLYWTQSSFVEP